MPESDYDYGAAFGFTGDRPKPPSCVVTKLMRSELIRDGLSTWLIDEIKLPNKYNMIVFHMKIEPYKCNRFIYMWDNNNYVANLCVPVHSRNIKEATQSLYDQFCREEYDEWVL